MKRGLSTTFLVLLVLSSLSSILLVTVPQTPTTKAGLSSPAWSSTTAIPTSGPYSCVDAQTGRLFCVGGGAGSGTHTYYARESQTGIDAWTGSNAYPISTTYPPACASDGSYIYCVGGTISKKDVYSASLSSSGFGSWTNQTSSTYPIDIERNGCVIYSGYIYCVAGLNSASKSNTYYATASSGTVGSWTATTAYPLAMYDPACQVISNTIICMGGIGPADALGMSSNLIYKSYSATLSSSGISAWSAATVGPSAIDMDSCVVLMSLDYCSFGITTQRTPAALALGNQTFFTSPSIFPNWQPDLPWGATSVAISTEGCASDTANNTIFCIGGYTNTALTTYSAMTQYTTVTAQPTNLVWNSGTAITGGGTSQIGGGHGYSNGIGDSCVWALNYEFCVQGNGTTRYANATSGIVGAWTKSTAYPESFHFWPPNCVTDHKGYIYCVGGADSNHISHDVYSSHITASGFGAWTNQSHTYPTTILAPSCAVWAGYVFCVAGSKNYVGSQLSTATYSASLSSGTVGAWTSGTAYPTGSYGLGCGIVTNGYTKAEMVCIQNAGTTTRASALTTSGGIGSWATVGSAMLPMTGSIGNANCVSNNSTLYCFTGHITNNHATVSVWGADAVFSGSWNFLAGTMSTWTRQTNLPMSVEMYATGNCNMGGGNYAYCVGGAMFDNDTDTGNYFTNQVWSAKTLPTNQPFGVDAIGSCGIVSNTCTISITPTYGHEAIIVDYGSLSSVSSGTHCFISTLSDGVNTYHVRYKALNFSFNAQGDTQGEWYTTTGSSVSTLSIVTTLTCASSVTLYVRIFTVAGANVNGTLFDPNGALPAVHGFTYAPGHRIPYSIISTTNANDMLIGALLSPATGSTTAPGGWTGITSGVLYDAYDIVTSTQSSVNVTWTGSGNPLPFGVVSDALEKAGVPVIVSFTCTLSQFGATSTTMAISTSGGGTVSPTSAACNQAGASTGLSTVTGVTLVATTPTISAGVGYWFSGAANSTNVVASSSPWSVTAYQLSTTNAKVVANAQTNFDTGMTWTMTCTQAGGAGTCTISSAAASSVTKYMKVDYKSNLIFPNTPTGAPANSRWYISGTATYNVTTAAQTKTAQYWKQWTNTWSAAANARSTFDATMTAAVTGNQLGSSASICTITTTSGHASDSCSGYMDNNQAATFATTMSGAPANEQWKCSTCVTAAQTSGGNTVTINYYNQLSNTYQASTNGQGPPNWDSGLSAAVSGTQYGSPVTLCTISPSSGTTTTASCSGYPDYNTAATEALTMSGAASGIQWHIVGTRSWTDTTGGNTHTGAYYKQVSNAFQITANGQSTFDGGLSAINVVGTVNGTGSTTLCSITVTVAGSDSCSALWSDYNKAATVPLTLTGAASNTRWEVTSTSSGGIITGGGTVTFAYWKQLNNTYTVTPSSPNTWDAVYPVAITGNQFGAAATICSLNTVNGGGSKSCFGFSDYNTAVTFPTTIGGWNAQGTSSFTDTTGGNSHSVSYKLIAPTGGSGLILIAMIFVVFAVFGLAMSMRRR